MVKFVAISIAASLSFGLCAAPVMAQDDAAAEGGGDALPFMNTPLTDEQFNQMVPKHPGFLGALAPANLAADRPAPPFNLTGTWFIDLRAGFGDFLFGPPYPEFYEGGQQAMREAPEYMARGENYRDSIGQCFPPGMPMIMTRVWPHAFVQLPTVVYMISGFNNSVRSIFLDGREFSDPGIVVPGYNGESIGTWEGDTLVIHSKYFEPDDHWIDFGLPISDEFELVERVRIIEQGTIMEVEYIMTDPQNWEGEWHNTKQYLRQDYTDINESNCILANNAHLPGTDLGLETATERGQSELED